ncbi:DIO1 [Branchiostoma lanceolatum]|uniref:Iodothyronine deiodinase n=1 Tax=Branchiostoma lanceolatum TaxID=7740 RepID=A0A8K0A0J4_BRALA|nr:DIO1 [Branchiostoma lanceolatum]
MVKRIMSDFATVADFVVVYVAEAHPTDGWVMSKSMDIHARSQDFEWGGSFSCLRDQRAPLKKWTFKPVGGFGRTPRTPPGYGHDIGQHRSLEERLAAAEMLALHDLPCTVLVDTMDNAAVRAYAAMPDRFYIVLDGVCVYKGAPGPGGYQPEEVRDWLQKFSG